MTVKIPLAIILITIISAVFGIATSLEGIICTILAVLFVSWIIAEIIDFIRG